MANPHLPERRQHYWSAPRERVIIQGLHWGVVVLVVVAVFVLALRGDLDKASVTALYGSVLGHAATAASQKLASRSTDNPAQTNDSATPPTSF